MDSSHRNSDGEPDWNEWNGWDRDEDEGGAEEEWPADGNPLLQPGEQEEDHAKLIHFFECFDALGSEVQHEVAEHLLMVDGVEEAVERFKRLPESVAMEQVNKVVETFVKTMPFANAIGLNMITSILSSHSTITGNPVFAQLIEKHNKATIEEMVEGEDAD